MKIVITLLSLFIVSITGYSQGFSTSATKWTLPSGGNNDGSHDYGFNSTFGLTSYNDKSLGWITMDINGDGKIDLVVTSKGNGTYSDCPGVGSNPHWDVYLNSDSGFSAAASSWTLPSGGLITSSHNFGFNAIYGISSYDSNCLGWAVIDMDGDGKPDLVVTSKGDGTYSDCPGIGSSPHWDVYLNSGKGFKTTASTWALPSGGKTDGSHNYGFNAVANTADNTNNSLGWNILDINGDGKPDLVITSKGDGSYRDCPGVGTSPHWNVFLNSGSGFSSTVTSWKLPSGGKTDGGTNFGFIGLANPSDYENNSLGWSTMDLDGDGKPDLVVTSKGDGTYGIGFGVGSSPHWDVYLNTGTAFSDSAKSWGLPAGGKTDGGTNFGFDKTFNSVDYENNSLGWSTMDIDGDGKPDLVVTSKGDGTYGDCPGVGTSPHWNVYVSNGSGFSGSATSWVVPLGGKTDGSRNFGFDATSMTNSYYNNSLGWASMDMNGDGNPDLVVFSKGDGSYSDCPGISSSPHWDVYLNNTVVTGITEQNNTAVGLKAYPIPFIDNIFVASGGKLIGESYRIYDYLGKVIRTGKIIDASGSIDLSTLNKGIYFLQIGQQYGNTCKLIKD